MNLDNYREMNEIIANLSVQEILNSAKESTLISWLRDNFYEQEASDLEYALEKYKKGVFTDSRLLVEIAVVLQFDIANLSDDAAQMLQQGLREKQRQDYRGQMCQLSGVFVETQAELVAAVKATREKPQTDDAPTVIYLCGGEFTLSMHMQNISFIGIDNPVVNLYTSSLNNLCEVNIYLENLTLYFLGSSLESNENDHIKNVNIIYGVQKNRNNILVPREVMHRNPFQTKDNYRQACENMTPIAVGTAIIDADNYDIDAEKFLIKPRFNVEFFGILQDEIKTIYTLNVPPEQAKRIYLMQRKVDIMAEFTASKDGNELRIKALFFYTEFGRAYLNGAIVAPRRISCISSGSGFSLLGYGLHLIKVEELRRKGGN